MYERIEDFFHQCIKRYSLTVKELGNMKYVMKDMLKLAKKKKYMAGIEIKSAHDIRRTVASEMFNNGVSVEIIRYYLGHS